MIETLFTELNAGLAAGFWLAAGAAMSVLFWAWAQWRRPAIAAALEGEPAPQGAPAD